MHGYVCIHTDTQDTLSVETYNIIEIKIFNNFFKKKSPLTLRMTPSTSQFIFNKKKPLIEPIIF